MSKIIAIYAYEFDWVSFGCDVKETIEAAGLTQKQVAVWCDCTPSLISSIVTGAKESSYTMDTYVKLCNVLDLHPGDYYSLKSQPITKFQE